MGRPRGPGSRHLEQVSPERAELLVAAMRGVHVLVVGDAMLDRYLSGPVDRVSPEAPVPVVTVESESLAVGGAGNVAANVAALGARCSLVSLIGADDEAGLLIESLKKCGVRAERVVTDPTRPTTVKTRVMSRQQQIVRVDRESVSDAHGECEAALVEAVQAAISGCDAVVLEDYNKGVVTAAVTSAALAGAKERRVPVVVDPKRRRFFDFEGATVFKPNARELEAAWGDFVRPDDAEWLEEVRTKLGCEHLLLTLGARGMVVKSAHSAPVDVPARARSVYDVSGAGDTVSAVVATAMGAGASITEAAHLANRAAALAVAQAGVVPVAADQLLDDVRRNSP